jgi:hypothetical protein
MIITKRTPFGVNTMDIPITDSQLDEIVNSDKHIQYICPELPACEREFLISGTTPKEWEKMFGGCSNHCQPCKYNVIQINEP